MSSPCGPLTCKIGTSTVVIARFMLCHVLTSSVFVTPLVSSATAASRVLMLFCSNMHPTPSSSHKATPLGLLNGTHERSAPCNYAHWLGCVHAQGANARDAGTCPMIEATYRRNHRRPTRMDESVERSEMHVAVMCVCVVLLLATKSRAFVL